MGTAAVVKFGSVKRLRYCCFLFCWSALILTVICTYGGMQTNYAEEYSTDPVFSTNTVPGRTNLPFTTGLNANSFEELPKDWQKNSGDLFMNVVRSVEKSVPSLPLDFWSRHNLQGSGKNLDSSQCARLPSVLDLEYSNEFWQRQRTSNGTFELLGAYLDNRKTIPNGDQFVRILGMVDRMSVTDSVQMYCQLWYDDLDASYIVPLDTYNYIWVREWGNSQDGQFQPYLMSCRIPAERRDSVPAAVSLVENKCDLATNCLRVIYNKPVSEDAQKNFAVCVKGMDFLYDDLSVRLVEWIELLSLLGADKIFIYDLQVHPNIRKVLDYYERQGRVEVQTTKLPGGRPNIPGVQHMFLKDRLSTKRQFELMSYNDCLYRNMYRYKYISPLDIDEVIMPKGNLYGWPQLMEVVRNKSDTDPQKTITSFALRNTYFLDRFYTPRQKPSPAEFDTELPTFLHMLRHTSRAKEYTELGLAIKCFHRSDAVLTLHNHYALDCITGYCNTYDISEEDAQLNHYRKDCSPAGSNSCKIAEEFVEDKRIENYKTKLIKRSLSALLQLGLVRPTPQR